MSGGSDAVALLNQRKDQLTKTTVDLFDTIQDHRDTALELEAEMEEKQEEIENIDTALAVLDGRKKRKGLLRR